MMTLKRFGHKSKRCTSLATADDRSSSNVQLRAAVCTSEHARSLNINPLDVLKRMDKRTPPSPQQQTSKLF